MTLKFHDVELADTLRTERDALKKRVEELEQMSKTAVCAWCGTVTAKEPEVMIAHQTQCEKRAGAFERELRAAEAECAVLRAALEDISGARGHEAANPRFWAQKALDATSSGKELLEVVAAMNAAIVRSSMAINAWEMNRSSESPLLNARRENDSALARARSLGIDGGGE